MYLGVWVETLCGNVKQQETEDGTFGRDAQSLF